MACDNTCNCADIPSGPCVTLNMPADLADDLWHELQERAEHLAEWLEALEVEGREREGIGIVAAELATYQAAADVLHHALAGMGGDDSDLDTIEIPWPDTVPDDWLLVADPDGGWHFEPPNSAGIELSATVEVETTCELYEPFASLAESFAKLAEAHIAALETIGGAS